jgi:flagella basal body P-ring formation protein FlgA
MSVKPLTLSLVFCALAASIQVRSATAEPGIQPLTAVRSAAVSALRRELDPALTGVELKAADLDSRLRLPSCSTPLEASATVPRNLQARVIVRVACKANANWSINVPVDIHRTTDVLVLRRAVPRGESLSAADVAVQSRVLPGLTSPYVSKVSDLTGRLTRRALPEGTAVTADSLQAALLIHRGQNVTLAASAGGLQVRAPGLALADASAHQRVRVQNLHSLKIVEGVADTEGVVRVNP